MVGNREMNLVFISGGQYPDGGASSNRHMAYARGLVELNNNVTFILLAKQQSADAEFINDGINFICVSPGNKKGKKNIISKLYSNLGSVSKARKKIELLNSEDAIDAIVLLDTHIWILYPFLKFCRKKNIKVFHERTEYPLVVERKGFLGIIHNRMYSKFILPRFDGIYVISLALKNYFNRITENKIPVSIINMVVDPLRFTSGETPNSENQKYLVYCGSMDLDKDGVDILIRSFGKAINESELDKDINLMLIGDNSNVVLYEKLKRIIEESKCTGKVIFTGLMPRQKVPELLINAHALALSRPDNKQAEFGFPTKLGEYLTTGKPVIITRVGEIGLFLKDGENAFLASAGSVDSFSEKISEVFQNYPEALKIGSKGRELVFNEFNYLNQAKKLSGFIEEIVQNHKVK